MIFPFAEPHGTSTQQRKSSGPDFFFSLPSPCPYTSRSSCQMRSSVVYGELRGWTMALFLLPSLCRSHFLSHSPALSLCLSLPYTNMHAWDPGRPSSTGGRPLRQQSQTQSMKIYHPYTRLHSTSSMKPHTVLDSVPL